MVLLCGKINIFLFLKIIIVIFLSLSNAIPGKTSSFTHNVGQNYVSKGLRFVWFG